MVAPIRAGKSSDGWKLRFDEADSDGPRWG